MRLIFLFISLTVILSCTYIRKYNFNDKEITIRKIAFKIITNPESLRNLDSCYIDYFKKELINNKMNNSKYIDEQINYINTNFRNSYKRASYWFQPIDKVYYSEQILINNKEITIDKYFQYGVKLNGKLLFFIFIEYNGSIYLCNISNGRIVNFDGSDDVSE